ncbi:hypothetical protein [Xenorhabdus szentirmaii]|uniref:Uncharacterized protein n=1 Tax=Xenorhabdus szentirmaii DSM 16338 TaxID=1427518 RepID=W1J322_9GAMM|nr:hypothetical protein [Xenorhabdus szentirmaii]PHM32058.1 hypothetical protein Xsze_02787 [Xenorhabdus szentirmaii DSM 16338]CDL83860.1 conserved hypothetical protein [Xenorhabdus szentirmaii DSM 16338]
MNILPTPVELNGGQIKFGALFIRPLRKRDGLARQYQVSDGEYSYGRFDSKQRALSCAQQLYRRIHEPIDEDAT